MLGQVRQHRTTGENFSGRMCIALASEQCQRQRSLERNVKRKEHRRLVFATPRRYVVNRLQLDLLVLNKIIGFAIFLLSRCADGFICRFTKADEHHLRLHLRLDGRFADEPRSTGYPTGCLPQPVVAVYV